MQNNRIVRASVLVAAGAAVLGLGGGIASAAHTSDGDPSARVESARQQARHQVHPDCQREARHQAEVDRQREVPPQVEPDQRQTDPRVEPDRQQPRRLAAPDPGPAPVPAPAPGPAPGPAPAPPNELA